MSLSDILGLALVVLGLMALRRLKRGERVRDIFFDQKDTSSSRQQIYEVMAEKYAEDEARRTRQWGEAASNLRAARQLQRDIQDELRAIDDIRRYMAERKADDKAGIQDIDLRRKEIEQELERVSGLIRQLRA